jgi:hypothetical protein
MRQKRKGKTNWKGYKVGTNLQVKGKSKIESTRNSTALQVTGKHRSSRQTDNTNQIYGKETEGRHEWIITRVGGNVEVWGRGLLLDIPCQRVRPQAMSSAEKSALGPVESRYWKHRKEGDSHVHLFEWSSGHLSSTEPSFCYLHKRVRDIYVELQTMLEYSLESISTIFHEYLGNLW